jgi:CxxC motif-containing protein (DUF1111 family)
MKTFRFASGLTLAALLFFPGMVFAQTSPDGVGGSASGGTPLPSGAAGDSGIAGVATPSSVPATCSTTPCDPGVRGGLINGQVGATATVPCALASVLGTNTCGQASQTPNPALDFFNNGLGRFQIVQTVDTLPNTGLGPRFNFNQCSACHSQPTIGGTGIANNPEFTAITKGIVSGADNTIPTFITVHGPTREARFPYFFDADGSPDPNKPNGGVEDLFTVSGLAGASSCSLQQPGFAGALATNDIIFRIPTPVFGAGLVENLDESTLIAVQTAEVGNAFGVSGTFNHNGNDGTIARFGWKAQNKSMLLFSGEAYNVEMGISNELFTQDRPLPGEDQLGTGLPAGCLNLSKTGYPEDVTNFTVTANSDQSAQNAEVPGDIVLFAEFMRLLAPPIPAPGVAGSSAAASIARGQTQFGTVGCATCHTMSIDSTQVSNVTSSLSNAAVGAFSDFEIHDMGVLLADNVSQGTAGGDQFRTAPLWGLGQRIFFLHDGRATDLLVVIKDHASNGSEGSTAEANFEALTPSQKQDVLNFLRSL